MKDWIFIHGPFCYFWLTLIIGNILLYFRNRGLIEVDAFAFVLSLWLGYKAVEFSYVMLRAKKRLLFYTFGVVLWFFTFGCAIGSFGIY